MSDELAVLLAAKPTLASARSILHRFEWRASRAFWLAVADKRRALSAAVASGLGLGAHGLGSSAASALPDDEGLRPSLREKMLILRTAKLLLATEPA